MMALWLIRIALAQCVVSIKLEGFDLERKVAMKKMLRKLSQVQEKTIGSYYPCNFYMCSNDCRDASTDRSESRMYTQLHGETLQHKR